MTRAELEQYVIQRIFPNNAQEITGEVLQDTLLKIVANLLATTEINLRNGEGNYSVILKDRGNTATAVASSAVGTRTTASGNSSFAVGTDTIASASNSLSEGYGTTASGANSHAEGNVSIASGANSHAEGNSYSRGDLAHSEGYGTTASGIASHAEGDSSQAISRGAHSEGYGTIASGQYSHAEGYISYAGGNYSHAGGYGTLTTKAVEFATGRWNKSETDTLFSVGNGGGEEYRKNAFEIKNNNTAYINGVKVMTQTEYDALLARIQALE